MFILKEVWAQHKTFFRNLSWMTYFTYHLEAVLAPNYKQQFCLRLNLEKICYLLPELRVKSAYLNLFGCTGGVKSMEYVKGAPAIEAWEPLVQMYEYEIYCKCDRCQPHSRVIAGSWATLLMTHT
jgi:hypothetical protein